MRKVVVTGGAGFIGSNLSKALLGEGYEVHIVDDFSAGKREYIPKGAVVHEGDVRDGSLLDKVLKDALYVFHLAARPRVQDSIDNPLETTEVNVRGLLQTLISSKQNNVKRFIFASSSAVYGDEKVMPLYEKMLIKPVSPYGYHKFTGEYFCHLWAQKHGIETVSLRYFNVYGPNCTPYSSYPLVIAHFIESHRLGKSLKIFGDGANTRDYVHVDDISRASIYAAVNQKIGSGEIINIGTGVEVSVNDIADIIGGEREYLPPRIEPKRVVADSTLARELLGWEPEVDFEEGIRNLLNGDDH